MSELYYPINLQFKTAKYTCHGCKYCYYSAPYGLALNNSPPHSRCSALSVNVPMIIGEHTKWLGSDIPDNCPEHMQESLF